MQGLTAKTVYHFSRPTLSEIKALSTEFKTDSKIILSVTVEEDLSKWIEVIKIKLFNRDINRKKILYIFQEDSHRVKLDVSSEYQEGKGQKPSKYPKRSYSSTNLEELKAQIKSEFDRWSFDK
jgi:hypothetical protein